MKNKFLITTGVLAFAAFASASLSMDITVKNGNTFAPIDVNKSISGDVTFKILIKSTNADDLITSVEFYVGSDLRSTDQSTPYEFTVDSLTEKDGTFAVTFAGYNNLGESVKKTLNLKIDNGMNKGVDWHVEQGNNSIGDGELAKAIYHGRVAIKIDPESNDARLLLSTANLGLGIYDLAQKYAEDVLASDAGNVRAQQLISGISLRRAFVAMNSNAGSMEEKLGILKEAYKRAAESQRRVVDSSLDSLPAPTDETLASWADAMMRGRRYSAVYGKLNAAFQADFKNTAIANRLLYALIRSGRFSTAAKVYDQYVKYGERDGYGYAVGAVLEQLKDNNNASTELEKEALFSEPSNLGVMSAQTFNALRRNNINGFNGLATQFATAANPNIVADYYKMIAMFGGRQYETAEATFQKAILADPLSYELLTERAYQMLASSYREGIEPSIKDANRAQAEALFLAALEARPESFEAHTGLALVYFETGKLEDALKYARAAVGAGPEYAAGHYVYSGVLQAMRRPTEAKAELDLLGGLDSTLRGATSPNALTAFRYCYGRGRMPFIVAPGDSVVEDSGF